MSERAAIGFSLRLQLSWLEETARLYREGTPREEIRAALHELLRAELSVDGKPETGTRAKAVGILLGVWVRVPERLRPLRDEGLEHLRRLPEIEHVAVHWGMSMAAYPFFGTVAGGVGRLLRLQATVSGAQVQRRLCEQLGERKSVAIAVKRLLGSLRDWGVLVETGQPGFFQAAPPRVVDDPHLAVWLMEAVLLASGARASSLQGLIQSPSLFPFALAPASIGTNGSGRMEVIRQGRNEDVVVLRTVATE